MPDLAQLNLVIKSDQAQKGSKDLKELERSAMGAETASNKLGSASGALQSRLSGLYGLVLKLTAGYWAWKAATQAISQAAQFETVSIAFRTLLKDADTAQKMIAELQKFAAETPFEFPGLAKAAKQLLSLGFTANQVIPILRIVGDTAAGLGTGQEGIESINRALGQMLAKGKVSAEEMNQLNEQGIKGWQYLADAIGVKVPEAMKLAEKGAINADQAVKALLAGMQKQFGGGMAEQARSLAGLWSTFIDEVNAMLRELGLAFIEAFNIKGGVEEATKWIRFLGTVIVDVVRVLAGLEPRFKGTGKIAKDIADAVNAVWPAIKQGWAALLDYIEKGWAYLKYGFNVAWETVKDGALAAIDSIRKGIGDMIALMAKLLSSLRTAGPVATGFLNAMTGGVGGTVLMGQGGEQIVRQFDDFAKELQKPIGTKNFDQYMDSVKGFGTDLDTELGKINKNTNKTIANSQTGFFADLKSLVSKIPGVGQLLEFKNTTLNEVDAAQNAGGGLKQDDVTKFGNLLQGQEGSTAKVQKRLSDMIRDVKQEQHLLMLSNDEREMSAHTMEYMNRLQDAGLDKDQEALDGLKEFNSELGKLQQLKRLKEIADAIGNAFSDALTDVVLHAKDAKEALMDLGKAVIEILFKKLVAEQIAGAVSGSIMGIFGPMVGGQGVGGGGFGTGLTSANGNVFSNGDVIPFADGGIVNRMSMFPMRGGRMGSMGERGPEAIMPLQRDAQGKLGIAGGGGQTVVHVNVYGVKDADSFRKSSRQIGSTARRAIGSG